MQDIQNIIDDVLLQYTPCFKLLGEYMEQSNLKCCDCIHAKASWFSKLTRNKYGYECNKYVISETYDPVLGKTTPSYIGACSTARLDRSFCGPLALLWLPKNKNQIFDYIQHLDKLPKE
jgi:hypothetical protein